MSELTGLPAEGPATLGRGPADPEGAAGVKSFLRINDAGDDAAIRAAVAAVNALVRSWPCSLPAVGAAAFPANVVLGADMLAARVFRRRESPAGVAAFGDLGPIYVQRNDPDVAMLLGLGPYARPQVG